VAVCSSSPAALSCTVDSWVGVPRRWRGGEVERWRGGGEVLSNFQEIKSRWLPLDAGRAAQI